jgi:hypothetical protein
VGIEYIYRHPSIFDNSRAAHDLGFKTTVPLVETFRRQIAWLESENKLDASSCGTIQDELFAAYHEGRDVDSVQFPDWNPWGNMTKG